MIKTAIFDIDGTIADASARMRFITGPTKDWDSFFLPENMAKDVPIFATVQIAELLYRKMQVVFCTGRPERTRKETLDWFRATGLPEFADWPLFMRDNDDRRPSADVKRDHLKLLREDRRIFCAFEDRADDAAMWRAEGVTCFQIAEGNF